MDSSQLRPEQAQRIHRTLQPMLGYLSGLQQRMEVTGFPPDDKLFRLTRTAYEAMHALFIETHSLGCGSGVGRGP